MVRRVLLVASLVVASAAFAQNGLTAKQAADLVREYGLSGTRDERRAEIVRALEGAPEGRTTAPLKKLAKDAPVYAAQLAAALRHPRTWAIVSPALTGEQERAVLLPLFPDPPADCREQLVTRWKKLEPGSPSHETLTVIYCENAGTAAADVDVFAAALREAARAPWAARVMAAILGMGKPGDRPEPAAVLAQWDAVEATWREHARAFKLGGEAIIPACDRRSGPVEARGANVILGPNGLLVFSRLAPWNARSHDVVFRFFPLADTGFRFAYASAQGSWTLTTDHAGTLTMKTGDAREASLPFTVGAWNEVKFSLTCEPGPFAGDRRITISVNGKGLAEGAPLRFNGALETIAFRSDAGRVVIGGAEIIGR